MSSNQLASEPRSFHPQSLGEWRSWLEEHYADSTGLWLINYKKASGKQKHTFDELIEEAICFGWIDSKPGKVDELRSKLWFAPRKNATAWSRVNKQRIQKLIENKRMHPAGLAKIAAAKADGSWTKLDAVENLEIPPDLMERFTAFDQSHSNFVNFPRSVKRGILEWILQAKRPQTRAKRIEETARLAAKNIRANQWR